MSGGNAAAACLQRSAEGTVAKDVQPVLVKVFDNSVCALLVDDIRYDGVAVSAVLSGSNNEVMTPVSS